MNQTAAAAASLEGRLADRSAWMPTRCSLAAALRVLGTRSAMLLMREAHYGTTRFDDFARRVGITDAVASARLRELTEAGLLRRQPYREAGQRTRYEYLLTPMGRDVFPALLALLRWGDEYLAGAAGPPVVLRHTGCGAPVRTQVVCEHGHPVALAEVSVTEAGAPAG